MRWLREEAMNVIAKSQLQAKRHTARTAADAAWQVNIQRMFCIHYTSLGG